MSFLVRAKKCDLITLAVELGEEVEDRMKVIDLKKLIENSENYEESLVKDLLSAISETRVEEEKRLEKERERVDEEKRLEKERLEEEKRLERERVEEEKRLERVQEEKRLERLDEEKRLEREQEEKRQAREFELAKLRLTLEHTRSDSENSSDESAGSDGETRTSKSRYNLQKLVPHYDAKEDDISLYLVIFERQATKALIKKQDWVSHLIGLLPNDINRIIARESPEVAESYDSVKSLLLKRFKLSPEKFHQKFVQLQKSPSVTWRDFSFEIRNYFEEWIGGLKVSNFDALKDLMIADQMKKRVPYDVREHFLDEWSSIVSSSKLAEKLDEYESVRGAFKRENNYDVQKTERRNSKNENFQDATSEKKTFQRRHVEKSERRDSLKCYGCGEAGHIKSRCPNTRNDSSAPASNHFIGFYDSASSQEAGLKEKATVKVVINNTAVPALIDTGSSLNLLREDIYNQNESLPELSRDSELLSGIGSSRVWTKGSFNVDTHIDGNIYNLTWHVVPYNQLSYSAVIGDPILKQAGLTFDVDGVKLYKYQDIMTVEKVNKNPKLKNGNLQSNVNVTSTKPHRRLTRSSQVPYQGKQDILNVNFHRKSHVEERRKIFIGGISRYTNENDLKSYFSKFGEVAYVNVKVDAVTGRPRCFAFVTFINSDSANRVLRIDSHIIKGRKVDVQRAIPFIRKLGGISDVNTN